MDANNGLMRQVRNSLTKLGLQPIIRWRVRWRLHLISIPPFDTFRPLRSVAIPSLPGEPEWARRMCPPKYGNQMWKCDATLRCLRSDPFFDGVASCAMVDHRTRYVHQTQLVVVSGSCQVAFDAKLRACDSFDSRGRPVTVKLGKPYAQTLRIVGIPCQN